jgi:hypothetical protein
MRSLKFLFVGVAVLGAVALFSGASFAQGNKEARMKVLQDSAAALQQSNPDLAKALTDWVNKESQPKTEAKKMPVDMNSPEWKAKHDARVKLLMDSAAALQATHPELAASLKQMAERKPKMEGQAGQAAAPAAVVPPAVK